MLADLDPGDGEAVTDNRPTADPQLPLRAARTRLV